MPEGLVDAPTTGGPRTMMMALRAHKRGGPEQLVYEQAPRLAPGESEILVAVRAAAITFAELTWPETWEANGVDRTPIIPSHEFAGVVAEVGPGVDDLVAGDEVFGLVPFDRDGAAAEYVVVPSSSVVRKPLDVPDVVAAAAALPALTAWEALREHAQLQRGQRILIRGGTGGVGSFLTQFARDVGAHVTVTAPARAVARATALGANRVIEAGAESTQADLGKFDVAIDAVGADTPEWLFAVVRPGGRVITLQEPADPALATKYGVNTEFFIVTARREKLDQLASILSGGHVEVAVAATFPLSEGRAAYESGGRPGRAEGKTVLVVGERNQP
jgi:NADPH:quinone reductase-like Zn-dependent oxidoreductase